MRSRILSAPARGVLGVALACLISLVASATGGEIIRDPLWITDGDVRAVAYTFPTVFIGGQFSKVGPAIGGLGTFDTAGGATVPPYAGVAGTVNAMAPDGAGGYYIGGSFTGVKGQPRNNLAHIDAAGTLTPWNPNASAEVLTLIVSGSTVYVGGSFILVDGQHRPYLAGIDAATGTVSPWFPSPGGTVKTLYSNGTNLYVGGSFHTIAGQTRHLVAAFDLATETLTGWAPNGDNSGGSVEVIRSLGSTIYIGGYFVVMGGQGRTSLAAVDATTGLATGWNAFVSVATTVHDIVITQQSGFPPTTTVWIAGSFTNAGGAIRLGIAGIDAVSGTANSFNPGANGIVRSILIRTHNLTGAVTAFYAAGDFTTIAGASRPYLASLTSAGAATAWDTRPNAPVRRILFAGPTILAGGSFTSAGMVTRANIAAFDTYLGTVTSWNPGADGPVNALLLRGKSLYVGGGFGLIATDARAGAAEIDIETMVVSPWNPILACTDFTCSTPTVYAIARATTSNVVFLGGDFKESWSQVRRNIVATDGTTGAPLAFNVNANFPVYSIALQERETFPFDVTTVYAGGAFNTLNAGLHGTGDAGVVRHNLAALNAATGQVTSWNPSPATTSAIHSIRFVSAGFLGGGTLWMGGAFPSMGGQARSNAAAVDVSTGLATTWDPNANGTVRALLLRSGSVALGGDFTSVGGETRNRLAAVDAGTGAPTPWNPDASGTVLALASYGGTIYAGGAFSRISNHPHSFFAGIGDGTATAVEPEPFVSTPAAPSAAHAAPNPFGERTTFRFGLPRREAAEVAVYDVAGRLVRRLHRGVLDAGEHAMEWSGRDDAERRVGSGIYFLRVEAASIHLSAKAFRLP